MNYNSPCESILSRYDIKLIFKKHTLNNLAFDLFADTVRKTERLNEGWKISGPMDCQNNGDAKQESYYSWLISPEHQVSSA